MVVEEEIGRRIKKIRLSKKFTLQDVANKTGLSSGYLSKLEKSKKSPPISTLISIAAAFDVTVSVLLGEISEDESILLVKKNQRVLIAGLGSDFGYSYESLAYAFKGRLMEPYVLRVPKDVDRTHYFQHEGQEMLYVIRGSLLFHYGEKEYNLEVGDTIYFDASVPHLGESTSDEDLVLLMVSVTPGKTAVIS